MGRPRKLEDADLIAYLADQPEGVTTLEVATHFGIDRTTARVRLLALTEVEHIVCRCHRSTLWLLTP